MISRDLEGTGDEAGFRVGTAPGDGAGRSTRELAGTVEERILDAAGAVFLERAFSGARVDGIAEVACAGKPTIYARFPGKEAACRTRRLGDGLGLALARNAADAGREVRESPRFGHGHPDQPDERRRSAKDLRHMRFAIS